MIFVTLEHDGLVVYVNDEPIFKVKNFDEALTVLGNKVFNCSSTLDFPEEVTDNSLLIDLCRLIRA